MHCLIAELQDVRSFSKWLEHLVSDQSRCYEPMIIQTKRHLVDAKIVGRHHDRFRWHYSDSVRSFTNNNISRLSSYQFSYANRIRGHWSRDQMIDAVRYGNSVISTWDPELDPMASRKPCLLTMKFVKEEGWLDLHCTYRKRDVVKRLPINLWCELELLEKTAAQLKLEPRWLYDYSYQLMIKQEDYGRWICGLPQWFEKQCVQSP